MSELIHVACNLCGSDDHQIVYEATPGEPSHAISQYNCTSPDLAFHDRIVKCKGCGLMYSCPREPDQNVVKNYTLVVDKTYLEEKEGRVLTFTRSLDEIEKIKKRGRLLDIGCYTGFFLEIARSRGWEVSGIEPSLWAAQYAREKLNLDVLGGTLKEANCSGGHFDVVTLWDVIEHLVDPAVELKEIHRILKEDGLLVISTIFMDTLLAICLRGKYPFLMKMHLYYFTRRTLGAYLKKTGFKIVKFHNHVRIVRMHYLASRLQPYSKLLYKIFTYAIKRFGWENRPVAVPGCGVKTVIAQKIS